MRQNNPKTDNELENDVESGLVTAREYADPGIFLPINPFYRLIKKLFLFLSRMYTKYQVVFNKNIRFSVSKLYQYVLRIKQNQSKFKNEIGELEKRIEILEKKLNKL